MEKSYTPEEISALVKVELNRVKEWLKKGLLKGERKGKLWQIRQSALEEFLAPSPTEEPPLPAPPQSAPLQSVPLQSVPPAEEFFVLYLDERNTPCGRMCLYEKLSATALEVDPEELMRCLEQPEDVGRAISAVMLTGGLLKREPALEMRAQAAILALIEDSRTHEGMVEGKTEVFGPVGFAALEQYISIVKGQKQQQIGNLIAAVRPGLKNSSRPYTTNSIVNAAVDICFHFSPAEKDRAIKDFCWALACCAEDRSLSAAERIAAYESILWGIERNFEKNSFELARRVASTAMVAALSDPKTEESLRDYVEQRLAKMDPQAIAPLQKKGVFRVAPIPELSELIELHSASPDQNKINKAALRADPEEVIRALKEPNAKQTSRLLAAIFLAPSIAARADWRLIARLLVDLIRSRDRLESEIEPPSLSTGPAGAAVENLRNSLAPGYRATCKIRVARVAAEQLIELLTARKDDPAAVELLAQGFDNALDQGLSDFQYSELGCWRFSMLFKSIGPVGQERLNELLKNCLFSRDRSAQARYLAYWELDKKESQFYALRILADEREDAGLRTLVGIDIHQRQPNALKQFVDMSASPWQPLPDAPALPICEPKEHLPISWIAAAVVAASDPFTRRRAAANLYARLLEKQQASREALTEARALLQELTAAYQFEFLNALRMIADDRSPRSGFWTPAAALLALIGKDEDEDRIIYSAYDGAGWTPVEPFTTEWNPLNLMLKLYDSDNAVYGVLSTLEPFIRVGYGQERARKMASRAFALIAENHLSADRRSRALSAYKWAAKLDEDNYNASLALDNWEES